MKIFKDFFNSIKSESSVHKHNFVFNRWYKINEQKRIVPSYSQQYLYFMPIDFTVPHINGKVIYIHWSSGRDSIKQDNDPRILFEEISFNYSCDLKKATLITDMKEIEKIEKYIKNYEIKKEKEKKEIQLQTQKEIKDGVDIFIKEVNKK